MATDRGKKTLERMVKDGRQSDVKRDGIPPRVRDNAIKLAEQERVTRMWKQPRNLLRSARLWESAFGVIDMRALNLVSAWTAYQNIMECLPPEKIISYEGFRKVMNNIMIPLGHAYGVRHVELSRMDAVAMSPDTASRAVWYVVNAQCLPLYVWYFNYRTNEKGHWKRDAHTVEKFMRAITDATPEQIDETFSVRYDHMWLGKFPRGHYEHVWVWNGRVWDGKGKPRDVGLATVHPTMSGLSYEESYIREHHPGVDGEFSEGEEDDQDE